MSIDEISEITAKKLNLHPIQVKMINRIQWKFLTKEIQSGNFKTVQLFYIGKFQKKMSKQDVIDKWGDKTNESDKRDI